MSDDFKKLYQGEFRPCPIVSEIVDFLRCATPEMISEYKKEGLLPREEYQKAREILNRERN